MYYNFSKNELDTMITPRKLLGGGDDWEVESKKLLDSLGINNNRYVYVSTCATNLIHDIFTYYGDEGMVVVSTTDEHPSMNVQPINLKINTKEKDSSIKDRYVFEELYKHYTFDIDDKESIYSLLPKIVPSEYILLYINSCKLQNGKIYTDDYLCEIYNIFKKYFSTSKVIFCLDDVQNMFVYHRNYDIYDYIIMTAHILVPHYNMGIVISKHHIDIGGYVLDWLKDYNSKIPIIQNIVNNSKEFTQEMDNILSPLCNGVDIILHGDNNSTNIVYNTNIYNIMFLHNPLFVKYIKDTVMKRNDYNSNIFRFGGWGINNNTSNYTFLRIRYSEVLLCGGDKEMVTETVKEIINIYNKVKKYEIAPI